MLICIIKHHALKMYGIDGSPIENINEQQPQLRPVFVWQLDSGAFAVMTLPSLAVPFLLWYSSKDLEGNDNGLIETSTWYQPGQTEESHERPQSG
jgi:hypothetical protein